MGLKVFAGGALRDVKRIRVVVGGVLRDVSRVRAMRGGQLRLVYSRAEPMSVTIQPSFVSGRGRNYVTTDAATASPAGGQAPFRYQWSIVETTSNTPQVSNPNNATTYFSAFVSRGEPIDATALCTVTDANGVTASGTVQMAFYDFGGGFEQL